MAIHSNTIKKQEKYLINNVTLHLMELKEEQMNLSRKEIINIRGETNGINIKKIVEKINGSKSWIFEKIKLTCLSLDSPR